MCDKVRSVFTYAGFLFALLGVICDAVNVTLVLESISGLLVAVVFFLASVIPSINWAMGMYLISIEAKSQNKLEVSALSQNRLEANEMSQNLLEAGRKKTRRSKHR